MSESKASAALWREAFAVFERLRDLDASALESELARLACEAPPLAAQVRGLLEADRAAQSRDYLGGTAWSEFPRESPESRRAAGDAVGPYRLVRSLGSGGMGEVWLARAEDGVLVALKLLHTHLLHSALRERFQREGRILAMMRHPHVARFYRAGVVADGQPYLALEFVEGERIDRYCDAQRLHVRGRLELFLQVCEAVAHAHAHLVVHRDLKPSNVLVTVGGVKLLDFGIAKLLEEGGTAEATELTRLGGRALTPEYAAPEQIAGLPLTTAADVHALGVMLYLLLCGCRPFGAPGASPAQVEREVLENEPPPPSQARARVPEEMGAEEIAQRRTTTPARLRAQLAGDLDTIVMKALKKDPAERYPSALALAEDLRRYLADEPVLARSDSAAYRVRKFMRRHRGGVAAAAAIFASVAAGVAGVVWQARMAHAESLRAERVKDYVVSVFNEQDPMIRPTAEALTPQQLVAAAVQRLDGELGDEPQVHAELLDEFGEIETNLGDLPGAQVLLQRAIAERRALFGGDSRELAETLRKLGNLRFFQGRVDDARRLTREALSILQRRGEVDTLQAARTKERLASYVAFGKGAPPEALALIDDALRIYERRLGHDHPETARALAIRAEMLEQARRDGEAEAQLRDAIGRMERSLGAGTLRLSAPLRELGIVLGREGKFAEAEAAYRRAGDLVRLQAGPRNVALAGILIALGQLYQQEGRLPDAETAYADAEAAMPEGGDRTDLLREQGRLYLEMRRPALAEAKLHQSYVLRRERLGDGNGFTWFAACEWGRGLAALGRFGEAEAIQREALKRMGGILGPDAYPNALVLDELADTLELEAAPDWGEIAGLRRRALTLTEARYPQTHRLWAERAEDLARALAQSARTDAHDEALALLTPALADFRSAAGEARRLTSSLLLRGRLEISAGARAAARSDLEEALERLQGDRRPEPDDLKQVHALLARLDDRKD